MLYQLSILILNRQNLNLCRGVQDINGSPALTFRGHAGQLIAMDPTRNIVVYIASFDKNYDFGNIFRGRDMDEFLNK